ncbi:MAG: immunoglobulin-like domain-containing protein [Ignavibacteriales bacterium]
MKKLFNVFLVIMLLITYFIPYMPVVYAEDCTYEVAVAYKDGDVRLSCHATYDAANTAMIAYNSTEDAVSVVKYNNKIINAEYALVNMDRGNVTTNLYDDASYIGYEDQYGVQYNDTYVHGQWGTDAAFIGYNDQYKAAKIMISGYTGYARISQVEVVPISRATTPKVQINATTSLNVRTSPDTGATIIGTASKDQIFEYYPSQTVYNGVGGYTWYKIKHSNGDGYVASDSNDPLGTWVSELHGLNIETYYYTDSNTLHHFIRTTTAWGNSNINLGTAPYRYDSEGVRTYYLTPGTHYYSFDGNYFYNSLITMLDDYKNGNYNNAVNDDTPYFNYFMYLPTRSQTAYTAQTFNQKIVSLGYTSLPTDPKSYVDGITGAWIKSNRGGLSQMYGMGYAFINSQNTYGINALQTFSAALTESGSGTSAISFYKNNLFGMGASDSNPFGNAVTYSSVEESIMSYAYALSNPTGYLNPDSGRFAGGHQGNKGSGINRWYASNPYSGEQHARDDYNLDINYGGLDNNYNTLGIKLGSAIVPVYKSPSTSSAIIYYTKNYKYNTPIPNLSYIVTDKVYDESGNGFYKVYTDYGLDENQNKLSSAYYNYENSYGYIRVGDLYVQNNQPVITASNISIKLDDTEQERITTITSNATATDYENGNLTSKITYDDSNVNYSTKGTYKLIYTVKDNSNFSMIKEVSVEITDPEAPMFTIPQVEVPQYTTFDPLLGVTVIDANPGSLSEITVTGTVDTNVIGSYTLTYSVTNMYNITTTVDRIVKVIANESPVINATNRTITQYDSINLMSGVTATDKESGDLTSRITVEGTVDVSTIGDYSITYKVLDDANQETTKTITVTVEEKDYIARGGTLHLEKLSFNNTTKLLDFTGFLKVDGIDINTSTNIKYDMVLENQYDNTLKIIGLNRWLSGVPFTTAGCGYAWFSASINLEEIEEGDYTIYIRARTGDYETKQILKNSYFKSDLSSKITNNSRGYLFRTDYSSRDVPLELFVRNEGLISDAPKSILYNMYNQYYSMDFTGSTFNLKGVSHSIGGNYGVSQTVTREIVIENIETLERVKNISIGSTTDKAYNVTLKVPDGFDKTRAWYNASIDISDLTKGTYAIYIRTKSGSVDDYGELYDYLFSTINVSTTYEKDGTTYKAKIVRNNDKRFRLELIIE